MEVIFSDRDLEDAYRTRQRAVRAWGDPVAKKYGRVVDTLYNASDQAELANIRSLRLHPLHGQLEGRWAVTLHDRWRLVLSFEGDTVRLHEVTQHYGD